MTQVQAQGRLISNSALSQRQSRTLAHTSGAGTWEWQITPTKTAGTDVVPSNILRGSSRSRTKSAASAAATAKTSSKHQLQLTGIPASRAMMDVSAQQRNIARVTVEEEQGGGIVDKSTDTAMKISEKQTEKPIDKNCVAVQKRGREREFLGPGIDLNSILSGSRRNFSQNLCDLGHDAEIQTADELTNGPVGTKYRKRSQSEMKKPPNPKTRDAKTGGDALFTPRTNLAIQSDNVLSNTGTPTRLYGRCRPRKSKRQNATNQTAVQGFMEEAAYQQNLAPAESENTARGGYNLRTSIRSKSFEDGAPSSTDSLQTIQRSMRVADTPAGKHERVLCKKGGMKNHAQDQSIEGLNTSSTSLKPAHETLSSTPMRSSSRIRARQLMTPPDSTAATSTASQSNDGRSSRGSSELTSLQTTPDVESRTALERYTAPVINSATKPVSPNTKAQLVTNITIADADSRSTPQPGPDLYRLAVEAQSRCQIPKSIDASVFRYIDGKWLAPQKCHHCQTKKWFTCNRMSPCSRCGLNGNCSSDSMMAIQRALKSSKSLAVVQGLQISSDATLSPLTSGHIPQNDNGILNSSPSTSKKRTLKDAGLGGSNHNMEKMPRIENAAYRQLMLPSYALQGVDGMWIEPASTALNKGQTSDLGQNGQSKVASYTNVTPGPIDLSKAMRNTFSQTYRPDDSEDPDSSGELISDFVPSSPEIQRHKEVQIRKTIQSHNPKASKKRAKKASKGGYEKYHQSAQDTFPEPHGQPPVWSDRRQALCETLPYYKAYQSGCYTQVGLARSFMVDKEVGPRDKFTAEVLIAKVGGGRRMDEVTGQMIQSVNQETSTFGLAFSRAKELKKPIAIIAGQGNKISPSKLPHYYNVLDWFHVTDVWCEKYDGLKTWMVRAEKIDLATKSWWAPADSPTPPAERDMHAFKTWAATCNHCRNVSKEIYNVGWTCLNQSCVAFFDFADANVDMLDYNEFFMNERTVFDGKCNEPLAPPLLTDADMELMDTFGVESSCARGVVCSNCKGCCRRIEWDKWTCEATPGCQFEHRVTQRIVSVSEAVMHSALSARPMRNPIITETAERVGRYNVHEYTIPGPEGEAVGIVRHFKSDYVINQQPDGPNDLFREMQSGRFGLKRNPARQKGSTGEVLTSHWAANWGAPYKFGVSVLSKGFDEAPPVILKALKRLTWAGEHAISDRFETFVPFNELLSIGYFEDTEIGYHDDGEKELGPTVATLSLGATATMSFRPKARARIGPTPKNNKGNKPDYLRVQLDHGDLIVMHGPGIQQYYEHAVAPHGKLRFALTCRYVRPETMSNNHERTQAMIKGAYPQGHEQYNYDGDVNAQPIGENTSTVKEAVFDLVRANTLAGHLSKEDVTELIQALNGLTEMGV